MKKIALFAAVFVFSAVSCQQKEEVTEEPGVVDFTVSAETVMMGETVRFTDVSLDVKSRTWTFQDATPATSTQPEVDVVFQSTGEKEVSLTVVFSNNTTDTRAMKVSVTGKIEGTISVSNLTPLGCIRIGEAVQFSLTETSGNPDTFYWTFEGGTPATSTEASPVVTFNSRDREMKVSCELSSSESKLSNKATATYIVGNYPLRNAYPEQDYDAVSFEYGKFGSWNCYNGSDFAPYSIVEGGACGTAHSLKISMDVLTEGGVDWADCFPRDAWASNASVEEGKTYELAMWIRADHVGDNHRGIGCIQIVSWLEPWMYDSGVDLAADAGWKDIFGVDFEASGNSSFLEKWYTDESEESVNMLPDNDWHRVSWTFTATKNARNVYPYFRVYTDWYTAFYVDEIELNLVED